MNHLRFFSLSLCSIFVFASWAAGNSQRWNSPRDYEPVILHGSDFSVFLGDSISHLFAFSYNAANDEWTPIPFQIDEVDDAADIWSSLKNHVLNANDEIIFLASDMGDKAPGNAAWIDDADSKNNFRLEITATDSLDGNKQNFIYFYKSSQLTDNTTGYMNSTINPQDPLKNTVQGISYIEKHDDAGIPQYWEIPVAAGGNGINLLDRQKIRMSAIIVNIIDLNMTENDLENPTIERIVGKIRIAERCNSSKNFLDIISASVRIPTYYYPYSIRSEGASNIFDDAAVKIQRVRDSFDLNSTAQGMVFHNQANKNIPIDGGTPTPDDSIHKELVYHPDVNWQMVTGNQGTILTLKWFDASENHTLYYYDRAISAQGADGSDDTGDMESWGDAGIFVTGIELEDRLTFPYTNYFLPKNQAAEVGATFAGNFKKPLGISVSSMVVPVELALFKAQVKKNDVILEWTTASESNNYGFEIHRTIENSSDWQKIGFIEGTGTSTTPNQYSFIDADLPPGTFSYRLKQIDFDGAYNLSQIIEVTIAAPQAFALEQNYPNPFNPNTRINYQIPNDIAAGEMVSLTIYNLLGTPVKTLIHRKHAPGFYTASWDGTDEMGKIVPTGIYIYRLVVANYVSTKRMVLMK